VAVPASGLGAAGAALVVAAPGLAGVADLQPEIVNAVARRTAAIVLSLVMACF
jgi:hypothetical protein